MWRWFPPTEKLFRLAALPEVVRRRLNDGVPLETPIEMAALL
jgi:hypothetical protein